MSADELGVILNVAKPVAESYLAQSGTWIAKTHTFECLWCAVFGNSGALELAMERWLGHCELLAAISSNWLSKGDFLPVSVIERYRSIDSGVSSAATGAAATAGPTRGKTGSHEDRLAEIGKINDRNKVRIVLSKYIFESPCRLWCI